MHSIAIFLTQLVNRYMTFRLIAVNIICFILTLGGLILTKQLGSSFELSIKKLQLHRLFTCMFIHDGISHLLCNMISLLINGMIVEQQFGAEKLLFFYLISGIMGSIITSFIRGILLHDNSISVGASGAICGLMGVLVAKMILHLGITGDLFYIVLAIIPLIIIGFSRGADNICHFASFFSGSLLYCMTSFY